MDNPQYRALQAVIDKNWPRVLAGDTKAIELTNRALRMQARMLGLPW